MNSSLEQLQPSHRKISWMVGIAAPVIVWVMGVLLGNIFESSLLKSFSFSLLLFVGIVTSYTDFTERKIPNWVTYPAVLWAIVVNSVVSVHFNIQNASNLRLEILNGWTDWGVIGISESLLGGITCFAGMLIIYSLAGGGAGDVKYAAVIGSVLGVKAGISVLLWAYIIMGGGILCWCIMKVGPIRLVMMLLRLVGSFIFPKWVLPNSVDMKHFLKQSVPLAPAFTIGCMIVLLGGNLLEGELPW